MAASNTLKEPMDITVRNLQSSIPVSLVQIQKTASHAGRFLKLTHVFKDISIVFVGTRRMRRINKEFLGHDYVTDVITFDLQGAAEIVICPQEARANAKAYGSSVRRELLLYVIHGLLHLAGYDDHKGSDRAKMRLKEQQLLDKLS